MHPRDLLPTAGDLRRHADALPEGARLVERSELLRGRILVQLRHVLRLARDLFAAQLQRGNVHGVPNRQVSIAGSDVVMGVCLTDGG